MTLAIKFSEEVVFINDLSTPFFYARDFAKAFYFNFKGLQDYKQIM